jgi:5-methyltetrahydrofolate--homocysteine methyltransferase
MEFSSATRTVSVTPGIPLIVGERANANGSRAFRKCLEADDFEGCLAIVQAQVDAGADLVDVSTACAGRHEKQDMVRVVEMCAERIESPVAVDSTDPEVVEAALAAYPGRCLVNSVNLEDGGAKMRKVLPLVREYGAGVVALTISTDGMAESAEDKLEVASRMYEIATGQFGLPPGAVFFDPLVFAVATAGEETRDCAAQTLRALAAIKDSLPGVHTVLGVSNVSYGLPGGSRALLNTVMLAEASANGLDAAIVDPGRIMAPERIPEASRQVAADLIYDRWRDGNVPPVLAFIENYRTASEEL